MANSKTIAGLVGPTLIALAVALLINLNSISALAEPVLRDPALVIVSGVISFVAGLAIVRVHNHWAGDWTVLVTIFGWLLLFGGLFRMLFPFWLAGMAADLVKNTGFIAGESVVLLPDWHIPFVQGLHNPLNPGTGDKRPKDHREADQIADD